MELLDPEKSLCFFKNQLPGFLLKKESDIQKLIEGLEQAFPEHESPNFHSVLLEKGEPLIAYIIQESIGYLSDKYDSPKDRALKFIKEYIFEFSRFEELLFGLHSKYRDHTLHSLWVYLFGHQWIMSMGGYDKILLNGQIHLIFSKGGERKFKLITSEINADVQDLEAMWGMIAILHDLGYPVQVITNEANEIFSGILDPFAIDFSSIFQIDIGSRISILHSDIFDLCSTILRPKGLTKEETDKHFEQADKIKKGLSYEILQEPKIAKDDGLGTEFKIAWVDKDHAAWSATLIFKNIPFLHESDYRGGGDIDFVKLLTRRDIIYSIVHHTSQEPKDVSLNRFQFILLFMDDIEEKLRYGKGGKKRGIVDDFCKIKWDPTPESTEIELDYSESEASGEAKYQEMLQRFKFQTYQSRNYNITVKVIDKDFSESIVLSLSKDL